MNKKKCRKDYSPQNSDIAAYGLISQTNMDVQELLAS